MLRSADSSKELRKLYAGKSTLVNLLFRFFDPTQGVIRFDGHDLREVSSADLRNMMALVSQDVVLFDMTVAENIALGKPGATREEIETAARSAFIHACSFRKKWRKNRSGNYSI